VIATLTQLYEVNLNLGEFKACNKYGEQIVNSYSLYPLHPIRGKLIHLIFKLFSSINLIN